MKLSKREQEQMEELFRWRGQKTEDKQLDYDPQFLENGQWVPYTVSLETCLEMEKESKEANPGARYAEAYDNINDKVIMLKFLVREEK